MNENMANNRMQLYCTKCLKAFVLAKYYPCEWYTVQSSDLLNDFFDSHQSECFKEANDPMGGTGMFQVRTENDEDGFLTSFDPYRIIKK